MEVLRCAACHGALAATPRDRAAWPRLAGELADTALACAACGEAYPVTHDGIPIVWTPQLRDALLTEAAATTALQANVSVYDSISDSYAEHWRQDDYHARRLKAAAEEALRPAGGMAAWSAERALRHLDVGSGPGHVLNWLSAVPSRQFALDVSLANLRNVRKHTRALAVLGSADAMPFADGAFDLVTESSVLHHIEPWERTVTEFARVCAPGGGVVLDWEPSRESKRWSRLAAAVFEMRWYPYFLMSRFSSRRFWFNDLKTARLTFEQAEIHNKPNTGLPVDEMVALLTTRGLRARAVRSADDKLEPRARMSWQEMLLHALSGHNPFNPLYGWFTVVASRDRQPHGVDHV